MEIILHKNNNKFLCAFKHRNYKSVSLIIRSTEYMYNYTNVHINNYETSQQEQQTLIELYILCIIRMYPRCILGLSPVYIRHISGISSAYPSYIPDGYMLKFSLNQENIDKCLLIVELIK